MHFVMLLFKLYCKVHSFDMMSQTHIFLHSNLVPRKYVWLKSRMKLSLYVLNVPFLLLLWPYLPLLAEQRNGKEEPSAVFMGKVPAELQMRALFSFFKQMQC